MQALEAWSISLTMSGLALLLATTRVAAHDVPRPHLQQPTPLPGSLRACGIARNSPIAGDCREFPVVPALPDPDVPAQRVVPAQARPLPPDGSITP